jgi:DeoR/GlpR family transcriptional regulator of sugar metabolism
VLEARKKRIEPATAINGHKLTVTRVMLIKKLLASPKQTTRLKMIAKQFGVSEMQIRRIKSGENWGYIKV